MVLLTNKITGAVFVRDVAFFAAMYFAGLAWLPAPLFFELLNGMLAAICLATVLIYFPSVIQLYARGANALAMIRLGICIAWSDQCLQALARIYFIEFRPEVSGRTFDASLGTPAVGYIIAAALHIIAIGMIENRPPRRNLCFVFWSLLVGIVAVAVLVAGHHLARGGA